MLADIGAALRAATTAQHLDGTGDGCNDIDERFGMSRRHFHLATTWGFLLGFAATSVATLMDHVPGWVAPYSWYSAPVVLGTAGVIGLAVGTAGLAWLRIAADRAPAATRHFGMDWAFPALLHFTATTALAPLFFRHTSAMDGPAGDSPRLRAGAVSRPARRHVRARRLSLAIAGPRRERGAAGGRVREGRDRR